MKWWHEAAAAKAKGGLFALWVVWPRDCNPINRCKSQTNLLKIV